MWEMKNDKNNKGKDENNINPNINTTLIKINHRALIERNAWYTGDGHNYNNNNINKLGNIINNYLFFNHIHGNKNNTYEKHNNN